MSDFSFSFDILGVMSVCFFEELVIVAQPSQHIGKQDWRIKVTGKMLLQQVNNVIKDTHYQVSAL